MPDPEALAEEFGCLFLRLHRLMDSRMSEQGASLTRTKFLLLIEREGPLRAADIADLFGQAPRTVTETIDSLERHGLVHRQPDSHDRRVKRIFITDAGRRAVEATEPLRLGFIRDTFGCLVEEERVRLNELLTKLTKAVDAQEQATAFKPMQHRL